MKVLGCVAVSFYDENFTTIFLFSGYPELFPPRLSYFFQRLATSVMVRIELRFVFVS